MEIVHQLLFSTYSLSRDVKGIVSRDFGTLFFISFDRFEGRKRAGAGLFSIVMTFSCLNFNKLCLGDRSVRVRNPGIITIRRTFGTRCAN
jgi:hypothetical protein